MRIAEAALTIVRARLETRSPESGLRSKDSRAVRRGAVGKVPDMGNSLAAYPTARAVLRGGGDGDTASLPDRPLLRRSRSRQRLSHRVSPGQDDET
jgi:hypothetical protein